MVSVTSTCAKARLVLRKALAVNASSLSWPLTHAMASRGWHVAIPDAFITARTVVTAVNTISTAGSSLGLDVGLALGIGVGDVLGDTVGDAEGLWLGNIDGDSLGLSDGETLGDVDGLTLGLALGLALGL